jgi:TPR repeat protein
LKPFASIVAIAVMLILISCEAERPKVDAHEACMAGNGVYCFSAGIKAYTNKDSNNKELAGQYMRRACNLGDGAGCSFLAATMISSDTTIQSDLSVALQLFRKGCDLGDFAGCEAASEMFLIGRGCQPDLNEAHRYHVRALELNGEDPKTGAKYKKMLKSINE